MTSDELPTSIVDTLIVEGWGKDDTKMRRAVFIHKGGYYKPGTKLIESLPDALAEMKDIVVDMVAAGFRVTSINLTKDVRCYWNPDGSMLTEVSSVYR